MLISGSDIAEDDIDGALLTSIPGSPPLDILVRTSGVRRLSNFFLWQVCDAQNHSKLLWIDLPLQSCSDTQVHFLETLWPSFGLWDLTPIIMDYQKKQWTEQRQRKLRVD